MSTSTSAHSPRSPRGESPEAPPAPSRAVSHGVRILLDCLRPNPAHVVARNGDLLAWNPGGLALFADLADSPLTQRNVWESQLRICVTHLRALSGLEPDAPDLAAIVGELVVKSPEFAALWRRYDVHGHTRGHKTFHHPEVGDLRLGYQSMTLNGTPG
jgi:hypothetical protein